MRFSDYIVNCLPQFTSITSVCYALVDVIGLLGVSLYLLQKIVVILVLVFDHLVGFVFQHAVVELLAFLNAFK